MSGLFHLELYLYCLSFKDERDIHGELPKAFLMAGCVEGIRRALVLGLVLIAGTAIEQVPSVCSRQEPVSCLFDCLLDLSCGECNVISLYFLCRSVCELFGETIRNI